MHPRPRLPFMDSFSPTTTEQLEALRLTKETMRALRDLCVELELPATTLDLAAHIYETQLMGVWSAEQTAKSAERDHKVAMIRKARAPKKSAARPLTHLPSLDDMMMPGVGGYMYERDIHDDIHDELCELSDAELDAEIERINRRPVSVSNIEIP